MITHCTKCNINWARLWDEQIDNRDDTVEFCPQCKSSLYLGPATDFVSYIKCHFTGRIINVDTGEVLTTKNSSAAPRKIKEMVYDESWEEFCDRRDKEQDECIDKYLSLCAEMSSEKAALLVEWPVIKRKFHFEEVTIL